MPLLLKFTTTGVAMALSVIVMEPVCVPIVVGVKVTLRVQLASVAIDLHVPVSANSPATTMLLITTDLLRLLVMIRFCPALVISTGVLAKVRLAAEGVRGGS